MFRDKVLSSKGSRAAIILLLILNIDFFPCIWGHKTLLESAQFCQSILSTGAWAGKRLDSVGLPKTLDPAVAAWFTEPSLAFTGVEYLHDRSIPLWNPYQGFGQPYAADMQSQPFYPLAILFSLHITPKTYNLFLLCRLFLAGIGGYLYLRLFVSFLAAVTGAVAAMLSGYFMMVISTPYLSVETLIPGALFAAELLIRNTRRKTVCAFALVIVLAIVGGMPESSFLLFAFVYSYMLFRITFDTELRQRWLSKSCYVLLATVIGLCLAAFLLLPLLELIRHSYNSHELQKNGGWVPGLWHDRFDLSILTYVFPLLFGQPFAPTLLPYTYNGNGARNYAGVLAVFLGLVALLSARGSRNPSERRLTQTTYFFFACALAVVLKRYGFPPIDSLGRLPLLRIVTLVKYDEPILSVCVAMLCGMGLERIAARQASRRVQIAALSGAFLTILVGLLISKDLLVKELLKDHVLPAFPVIALGLPVCLLFCLALCYIAVSHKPRDGPTMPQAGFWRADIAAHPLSSYPGNFVRRRASKYLTVSIFLLLTCEMSLNYIPELYYAFSKLPDASENPYAGAPYIKWLKARTGNSYRMFARGGALYPDWASAFQLPDIRNLDALYYWKYLPFVRNFMLLPGQLGTDDFQDRFTGAGSYEYSFATPVQQRLLQLSSVRYLVTNKPYLQPEFQLAYDREVKIYSYDHVLPRAALYFRAEIAKDDAQVLQRLSDPAFDVFHTVLLNARQLKPEQLTHVSNMNQSESRPVEAGSITAYQPLTVDIDALLEQSGILVLNDSDYPGWEVSVDSQPSKTVTANYLFRGVFIRPGRHRIHFSYLPRTFRLGAGISMLTLVGLIFWLVSPRHDGTRIPEGRVP